MVTLKLQKRLAVGVLKRGKGKVWPDPNEVNEISMANSLHTVKGQDSLTLAAATSVHASGRVNSRSMSSEDHGSLALNITPKGHDGSASSKTLKRHESLRADRLPEIGRSQAWDAVFKVYNASTSITGEPKDQDQAFTFMKQEASEGNRGSKD